MKKEREFWEQIGIIIKKPYYYTRALFEELWLDSDEDVKIDGARLFNVDELPWIIDIEHGNVSARDEETSLNCTALRELSKYRKGTIVLVTNCFMILFIMVIFRIESGGALVLEFMNGMWSGNLGTRMVWTATESGSLTASAWELLMRTFASMTKTV